MISESNNLDPQSIPWLQRLEMIQNTHGFTPITRGEINDIFVSVGETGDGKGFVAHLSEIHTHQQKHRGWRPQRKSVDALKSRLRSMECNAHDSLRALEALYGLSKEIEGINPRLDLATIVDTEEPEARPHIIKGVMELVRLDVLAQAAALGDPYPFRGKLSSSNRGTEPKLIITPNMDKLIEKHLGDFLRETTVLQAQQKITDAEASYMARYNFWDGLLSQASRHEAVSDFSRKLMENLDFAAGILGINRAV